VGGKTSYKTNCRLVAATNRKTDEAIKMGKLREDLFYRISAIAVHLPPLRDRREDIMPMANAFLKRFAAQANRVITGFTQSAVERLTAFDWPGNVRQLQHVIERLTILAGRVDRETVFEALTSMESRDKPVDTLADVQEDKIREVLAATGGNKSKAAQILGIERKTLYRKLERMKL
jgi:DNA-binding NtrC family response regulator